MSLTVKLEGQDSQDSAVSRISLDRAGERWIMYVPRENSGADEEICGIWNPFAFPTSDCDPSLFRIAIFTHKDWPESGVLSLTEGSRSVGLIFSVQALTSRSTVLTANAMLNGYGFLALSKLCTGDTFCYVSSRQITPGETYEISDFYDDDSVVVILHRSVCGPQATSEDDFKNYIFDKLPTFARSGLFLQLEEGSARVRQSQKFETISEGQSYIRLQSFSPDLPTSTRLFMVELLTRNDPYEKHPAFRFFLYYQVFESLIQEMYEDYYTKFSQLALETRFRRASAMKDLVEWLREKLSEKNRLGVLVGTNRRSGDEFDSLRDGYDEIMRALAHDGICTSPVASQGTPDNNTSGPVIPDAATEIEAPQHLVVSAGPEISPTETNLVESEAGSLNQPGLIPAEQLAAASEIFVENSLAPAPTSSRHWQHSPRAVSSGHREETGLNPPSATPASSEAPHAKLLYDARNLLFHNFSKVMGKGEELEELANSMARAVYVLAIRYQKPHITPPNL
jgi:hypothetical protein